MKHIDQHPGSSILAARFLAAALALCLGVFMAMEAHAQGRGNRGGQGQGCGAGFQAGIQSASGTEGCPGMGRMRRGQGCPGCRAARGAGQGTGRCRGGQCWAAAQAEVGSATLPSFPELRNDFQTLMHNHGAIVRSVEEIPQGVRTTTLTSDPKLLPILRKHPREIREHLERGGAVRLWDPLFAEINHRQKQVLMNVRDIDGGVEVTTTSENPEVVKLIRTHAAKVSDFVKRGPQAAHEETALPEGYTSPEK